MPLTAEDLLALLDDLLTAKEEAVIRAIDAGACRTAQDFRRAHDARDAFEAAHEKFEAALHQAMQVERG